MKNFATAITAFVARRTTQDWRLARPDGALFKLLGVARNQRRAVIFDKEPDFRRAHRGL